MSIARTFFSLLLIQSLISCNPDETLDINQEKIFTDFELYYLESENTTYARARFRYKDKLGRSLKLSEPGKVTFNGDNLIYNEDFQQYERVYSGFIKSGVFVWQNTEEQSYSNSIRLKEIHLPDLDTINKSSKFYLEWLGEPLAEQEWVTLVFSEINGAGAQIVKESSNQATSIDLTPRQLSQVYSGNVTLILERSYLQEPQEKTEAGGSLTGVFRPVPENAYLW